MAKKKAAKKTNEAGGRKPPWIRIIVIFALIGLVAVSLPSMMLIFFGMLPTWVAFLVDREEHHHLSLSVGGLNFCGVFPYLMELWSSSNSIGMAITLLTDVFNLVIMLGAAAFGWALFIAVPPVIVTFLTIISDQRVASLRQTQRELIDEWGESVSGKKKS